MTKLIPSEESASVLQTWHGANAKIWQFHASLGRLAIQIYRPLEGNQLYLVAVSCLHIAGPFHWTNNQLEIIERSQGQTTLIQDHVARFELHCYGGFLVSSTMAEFDLSKDSVIDDE